MVTEDSFDYPKGANIIGNFRGIGLEVKTLSKECAVKTLGYIKANKLKSLVSAVGIGLIALGIIIATAGAATPILAAIINFGASIGLNALATGAVVSAAGVVVSERKILAASALSAKNALTLCFSKKQGQGQGQVQGVLL